MFCEVKEANMILTTSPIVCRLICKTMGLTIYPKWLRVWIYNYIFFYQLGDTANTRILKLKVEGKTPSNYQNKHHRVYGP